MEHAVEFLYNSILQDNKITSTVGGKKISILEKSQQKHFDIEHSGLDKLTDEAPDAKELCAEWTRPDWTGEVKVSMKTKSLLSMKP